MLAHRASAIRSSVPVESTTKISPSAAEPVPPFLNVKSGQIAKLRKHLVTPRDPPTTPPNTYTAVHVQTLTRPVLSIVPPN